MAEAIGAAACMQMASEHNQASNVDLFDAYFCRANLNAMTESIAPKPLTLVCEWFMVRGGCFQYLVRHELVA